MWFWEQEEAYERRLAGHSVAEISRDLGVTRYQVECAIRRGGEAKWLFRDKSHMPSRREIAKKVAEIRAGWSRKTEIRRRVVQPFPFEFPVVSERDLPVDLGLDPIRIVDVST